MLLTPGTQQLQWQHAASENPQGSTQTMVNGQHFSGTGYQLDGTENRDPILGIIVINPTLESIGETKITSQNYDAEFGQAMAGVVSVQTKSGTNDLHGSAFEFYQSDKFQARNPFTQFQPDPITGEILPETTQEPVRRLIGGPIVDEPVVLLRRLPGHARQDGRLAAVDRADGRGAQRRPQRVRRRHLRPGVGVPAMPRSSSPAIAFRRRGSRHRRSPYSQLDSDAERAGPRQRHTRQLRRLRLGDLRRELVQCARSTAGSATSLNTFGRYSFGDFFRDGPTAFGYGRRRGARAASAACPTCATRASRIGVDCTFSIDCSRTSGSDGSSYKVNVLPFDFGTTPAADAGIPGLNLDSTFTSGLPAFFIDGGNDSRRIRLRLGPRRQPLQLPARSGREAVAVRRQSDQALRQPQFKFGIDVRRAYNLRVPSDAHRSGELTFQQRPDARPNGGGLGLATFLLGDVTRLPPLRQPERRMRASASGVTSTTPRTRGA